MAYATQADLVPLRLSFKELAQLTSDSGDQPDAAVVGAALDEASGKVDAYCGQRYRTPLQASQMVKEATLNIAVYLLATKRRQTKALETWRQNYDDTMKFLQDVAAGKASLDQPANAAPQSSSNDVVTSAAPQRFDDCNLQGWA